MAYISNHQTKLVKFGIQLFEGYLKLCAMIEWKIKRQDQKKKKSATVQFKIKLWDTKAKQNEKWIPRVKTAME